MEWAPSSARCDAESEPARTRIPLLRTAPNVRRSRIGPIRPTAWPGPSGVGCAERHAQPSWTSACGNRDSWPACGRWVERCASLGSSLGTVHRATVRGRHLSVAARHRRVALAPQRRAIRATLRPHHGPEQSRGRAGSTCAFVPTRGRAIAPLARTPSHGATVRPLPTRHRSGGQVRRRIRSSDEIPWSDPGKVTFFHRCGLACGPPRRETVRAGGRHKTPVDRLPGFAARPGL